MIRLSFQELAEVHHWDLNPAMAGQLAELLEKLLAPALAEGPRTLGGEIRLADFRPSDTAMSVPCSRDA
jgi:hypothetical protein